VDASDRELQQYLFDLQGYLVIHNVLGAAEVAELNRLIDAQRLPSPRDSIRFGSAAGKHGPDHGFLNWGKPFCRLLDHEAIMPILRFRLGDCFRLDRLYGIRMHKGQTMGAMHADYGASALNSFTRPGERFHFAPNGIYEGFTVAAWNLADAGPAYGGFWCIPGSHKSNFKLPRQIHEAPEKASCVVIPEIPAGSVVLFSEAVMHGTPRGEPITSAGLCSTSIASPTWRGRGRACLRHPMSHSARGSKRFSPSRRIHIRSSRRSSAMDFAWSGRAPN
jgi:hypothetical protein